MDDAQFVEAADPEEAFAALSDGTRVDILRALWDADESVLSFSDLRAAVGVEDSGGFNYHLDKLGGRFVVTTEEGYRLTQAGRQVAGAIDAGAYTVDASVGPIDLDEPCPACAGARTLTYEDGTATVECDSCDVEERLAVPPAAFADCDRADIPAATGRYLRSTVGHLRAGFCSFCDGPVDPTVVPLGHMDEGDQVSDPLRGLPWVRYDCRQCESEMLLDLGVTLADHPAVVSFLHDRGVDVRDRSIQEFAALNTDRARVRRRDPVEASVDYTADGDTLTLVVDESLAVVAVEDPD